MRGVEARKKQGGSENSAPGRRLEFGEHKPAESVVVHFHAPVKQMRAGIELFPFRICEQVADGVSEIFAIVKYRGLQSGFSPFDTQKKGRGVAWKSASSPKQCEKPQLFAMNRYYSAFPP